MSCYSFSVVLCLCPWLIPQLRGWPGVNWGASCDPWLVGVFCALPPLGVNQGQQQEAVCFGNLLDKPSQQLNGGFSCLVLGILVSLVLVGSVISSDEESSLKVYMCIYTLNCGHYGFLKQIVNSMILCSTFRYSYCYVTTSVSCISLPLPFLRSTHIALLSWMSADY